MSFRLKVEYKVLSHTHEGSCFGSKCELSFKNYKTIFPDSNLDEFYDHLENCGGRLDMLKKFRILDTSLGRVIKAVTFDHLEEGVGDCDNDIDCEKYSIGKHESIIARYRMGLYNQYNELIIKTRWIVANKMCSEYEDLSSDAESFDSSSDSSSSSEGLDLNIESESDFESDKDGYAWD